jgi:hypothetical protein
MDVSRRLDFNGIDDAVGQVVIKLRVKSPDLIAQCIGFM